MFDYETLRLIAWLAIAMLIIAFAIIDSHDMGVGILLPFLGKTDYDRYVMINFIAPHWNGSHVWLIASVAAIFSIWPTVYAIVFPKLYAIAIILLFSLLLRSIAFEYRAQISTSKWRRFWDWTLFIASAIPSILIGIAFGNLLLGIPFRLDNTMSVIYEGNFLELLNPFALFCGATILSLLILQGTSVLAYKTQGNLQIQAIKAGRITAFIMLTCFSITGFWVASLKGIIVDTMPGYNGIMTALTKTAYTETGAWINNYKQFPILCLAPCLVYIMVILTLYLQLIKNTARAFFTSTIAVIATMATAIIMFFPFVLPSSIAPSMSITLWDGSLSYYSLVVILIVALIFIPAIITYATHSYYVAQSKHKNQQ